MAKALVDYVGPWEDYSVQVEEFRALDNERVLVLIRQRGRGRTSGLDLTQMQTQAANVVQVRNGKAIKFTVYWDRDRALADLGLQE